MNPSDEVTRAVVQERKKDRKKMQYQISLDSYYYYYYYMNKNWGKVQANDKRLQKPKGAAVWSNYKRGHSKHSQVNV